MEFTDQEIVILIRAVNYVDPANLITETVSIKAKLQNEINLRKPDKKNPED